MNELQAVMFSSALIRKKNEYENNISLPDCITSSIYQLEGITDSTECLHRNGDELPFSISLERTPSSEIDRKDNRKTSKYETAFNQGVHCDAF